MADTKKLEVNPERPKAPEGFWSLPGGASGLQGSVDGVLAAIDAQADIPAHDKVSLKERIKAHLDGIDHNFVTVHAHAQRRDDASGRHSILNSDILSKKTV